LAAWKERAAQHFNLPVHVVEGLQPLVGRAKAPSGPGSPVVVGGAACADAKHLLNLNPPEMRLLSQHRTQLQDLFRVGAFLVAALLLGGALGWIQVYRQHRVAEQLANTIAEMEPVTRQVRAKTSAMQVVASVMARRRQIASLLGGIFRVTPSEVSLEGVTFERRKHEWVLRGRAPATPEVLAYVQALKRLQGVQDVRLKYATGRETAAGGRTDFEVLLEEQEKD
jgi:hypothetical protein